MTPSRLGMPEDGSVAVPRDGSKVLTDPLSCQGNPSREAVLGVRHAHQFKSSTNVLCKALPLRAILLSLSTARYRTM